MSIELQEVIAWLRDKHDQQIKAGDEWSYEGIAADELDRLRTIADTDKASADTCQMCGEKAYPGCNSEFQGEKSCRFYPAADRASADHWRAECEKMREELHVAGWDRLIPLVHQAADEIDRLHAENDRLRSIADVSKTIADHLRGEFEKMRQVQDGNGGVEHLKFSWSAVAPMVAGIVSSPSPAQADACKVPQWQPIETAQKDGAALLLFVPEAGGAWAAGPWRGYWSPAYERWMAHLPVTAKSKGGVTELHAQPTHWMPLPAAPKYPADDGPLTDEQVGAIKKAAPRGHDSDCKCPTESPCLRGLRQD